MNFISTIIKDVFIIEPDKKGDDRGWFMRTFDLDIFKKNIPSFDCNLVQINQSYNKSKYTWRGFHYQMHPFSETSGILTEIVLAPNLPSDGITAGAPLTDLTVAASFL
jgi:dTDP-4-dehydrorhamnose 3,5-epimerase-like enzyme